MFKKLNILILMSQSLLVTEKNFEFQNTEKNFEFQNTDLE